MGLGAILTGCPDAQRGTAGMPEGENGADGGGSSDGGDGGTSPGVDADANIPLGKVQLAEIAGHVALSSTAIFVSTKAGVVTLPKSGGTPVTVVAPPVRDTIRADDTFLFFVDGDRKLTRVGHDGTKPKVLTNDLVIPSILQADDATYWASFSGAVRRAAPNDDAPTTVRNVDAFPYLVGVTPASLVVLVADEFNEQELVRRPKTGATAADVPLVTTDDAVALATHGGVAYWMERTGAIRGVDVDGSAVVAAISGPVTRFDGFALAVDATHVYWTSRTEGRVYRATRAEGGSSHEVVAEGFTFPDEVASFGTYWSSSAVGRIAVDDTAIYVSDDNALFRIGKP